MSGHRLSRKQATVREAAFDLFRAFGMTTIFGNPGSTELPMFRDFPADFRYVLALQESVAVGMADGYAQATRNAALVNLHSATGLGHALGAVFTAYKNQTPLVITAGQQARSMLPFEPFLFAEKAAEFPKPYVKWSCEPARAEDVPAVIARAYYTAMQPPRGPTFVSVPVDDWDRFCDPVEPRRLGMVVRGDPAMLAEIAEALCACLRPALVVGAAVARDDAWDEVVALAERHQAAVWAAPNSGRNSFPEDHPLFAGFLAADREKIVASLDGHDLILVLGAPVFTYHVEGFGGHIPDGARLFQLTGDPTTAAWAPVGLAVVTNLRSGIRDLLDGPDPRPRPSPAARPPSPRLSGPALDRQISDATSRSAAAERKHHRRGSAEQPAGDARLFADGRPRRLLHLRQRRSRTRTAGGDRHRTGARHTKKSLHYWATVPACTRSRDCGQRLSSRSA